MNPVHYLATIAVKNYAAGILVAPTKFVSMEEVLAVNDNEAKINAYEQFMKRCRYEPIMRRRMTELELDPIQCYVSEVISI